MIKQKLEQKLQYIYEKGLSDAEIAKRIGVNTSTVYRMRVNGQSNKIDEVIGLINQEYKKARRRK